jgi:hypothetical protein
LELADKADLDKLNEFASIEIWPRPTNKSRPGTRITACNLKSFVRRELRTERRKGYVRNIASRDGLERLRWYQSRCTPVCYASTARPDAERLQERLPVPSNSVLRELRISHGGTSTVLKRPLYPLEPDALPLYDDMLINVRIDGGGLKAAGFIAGYESVIFPAEYRGITVRVRGVAIGDPHFFGAEHLLTGASKAALSQITGEMKKYLLRIAHDLNVPVTVRKVPDGVIFWRSSDEDRHQAQEVASRLQGARHKRSRARGGQQRRPGTRTRTR